MNGFRDRGPRNNAIVAIDDRKSRSIVTALEINRFVLAGVEMNDLTWFQANANLHR